MSTGSRDTIVLNGRRYDARSGLPVELTDSPSTPLRPTGSHKKPKMISDISRMPRQASGIHTAKTSPAHTAGRRAVPPAKQASALIKPKTPKPGGTHRQAAHLKPHRPESAKTLMRTAVKKPAPSRRARVQLPVGSRLAKTQRHLPTKPSRWINAERQGRASQASQSPFVRRFQPTAPAKLQPIIAPLPVQPAHPTAAAPLQQSLSAHQQRVERILHKADSHTQLHPAKRRRFSGFSNRFAIITATAVLVIIVGGFLVVQNLPHFDVRLASLHAGFQAELPGYAPAGFEFVGHVQASPGKVVLSYRSTTDTRTFSIDQQVSNWDSQTLHNFVASSGQSLRSLQAAGRTLYMYGNHLTWVSGGVWYQITNHADLSSTQLLNVAKSM